MDGSEGTLRRRMVILTPSYLVRMVPKLILHRDTVSSVGLVRGNNFLSASSSVEQACHFRHALALDERRVKFMPEYFCEVNSWPNDKYIPPSAGVEPVASHASELRKSTISDEGTYLYGRKKSKSVDIKEVWFPGSHSDV